MYDFVVRHPAPVSRDEAAEAVGAPRTTVAFHLDRLVAEGLLEVVHERRTGRTGPGAGRPAKLYRRSAEQIAVSLPDRRYELAGMLPADALVEAEATGEPPRAVLHRRAHELGRTLGDRARDDTVDSEPAAMRALELLRRFQTAQTSLAHWSASCRRSTIRPWTVTRWPRPSIGGQPHLATSGPS
ncbi:MAG: hypothetical protein HOV94_15345 [Saccharothrix sp.]|nr:hypothetical protein [Saccharothrix sp.]